MDKMRKQHRLDQTGAASLLPRPIRIEEIEDGKEGLIQASSTERAAIASMLDLVGLDRLELSYRLWRRGGDRIGLSGTLEASATQTCVISLEPVRATLELPVEVEFWPPHLISELETANEPVSNAALDWPEPIIDGKIDLGRIVYESLATGLDPYPRANGAEFGWPSENASGAEAEIAGAGPFAALERLKRR